MQRYVTRICLLKLNFEIFDLVVYGTLEPLLHNSPVEKPIM